MPIVHGHHADRPTDEVTMWGYVEFPAGTRNVTEPHFHDCDEWVFMIAGRCVMREESRFYTLRAGDVLVTRMGDEHELTEIIEDTRYLWYCGALRGRQRPGHLHRGIDEAGEQKESHDG